MLLYQPPNWFPFKAGGGFGCVHKSFGRAHRPPAAHMFLQSAGPISAIPLSEPPKGYSLQCSFYPRNSFCPWIPTVCRSRCHSGPSQPGSKLLSPCLRALQTDRQFSEQITPGRFPQSSNLRGARLRDVKTGFPLNIHGKPPWCMCNSDRGNSHSAQCSATRLECRRLIIYTFCSYDMSQFGFKVPHPIPIA